MEKQFDLIVIGSGIAGVHGADIARNLGKKVAIVEGGLFGGSAVHEADLALNYLAEVARAYQTATKAPALGVNTAATSFNYTKIRSNLRSLIKNASVNIKEARSKAGIEIITGKAYFLNPGRISVNGQHYRAEKFLIATGCHWQIPKIAGLGDGDFYTPQTFLDLTQLPASVFIIGGSHSAITIAQILAVFGVRVYLTTKDSRLLPEFGDEFNQRLEHQLANTYDITISTNSQVLEVTHNRLIKNILFSHAGIERRLQADEIIIAEKLLPNLDLGLVNACVQTNDDGVLTDKNLRTSSKHIFAAGGVLGNHQTATSATVEAETAIFNAFKKRQRQVNYQQIPVVIGGVFPIARVGLSEDDCTKQSIKFNQATVDFAELPRSVITPSTGALKIITSPSGKILGAEVFGNEAEAIIQQLAYAIARQLTVKDLIAIPQAFLSWQEAINAAANKLL